jgi:hypothetical protein
MVDYGGGDPSAEPLRQPGIAHVWNTCTPPGCGTSIYASQPGRHCRIRDKGPVSMWEDEHERTPDVSSRMRRNPSEAGGV